jgi:hypothetical protein
MKSFAKRLGTRIACAGTISANGELLLDEPLPQNQPGRVPIVILFPEAPELADLTPAQWNKTVANNPSFAFLHDPEEDDDSPRTWIFEFSYPG